MEHSALYFHAKIHFLGLKIPKEKTCHFLFVFIRKKVTGLVVLKLLNCHLIAACAAATLAIGTLKGEQLT